MQWTQDCSRYSLHHGNMLIAKIIAPPRHPRHWWVIGFASPSDELPTMTLPGLMGMCEVYAELFIQEMAVAIADKIAQPPDDPASLPAYRPAIPPPSMRPPEVRAALVAAPPSPLAP